MKVNTNPIYKFHYAQYANKNFTFALLNENMQYVHTPFMCKDYLQDIFWSQAHQQPGEVCGLDWEPEYLPAAPRYNLALHGGEVKLAPKVPFLQEFLNLFDKAQGIELSTVTETEDPFLIVVNFDRAWTNNGPLLSAFTTLIRVSGAYTGGDPRAYLLSLIRPLNSGSPRYTPLWTPDPGYMTPDIGRFGIILPRLFALLDGKTVKYPWTEQPSMSSAHEHGIMGFTKFPTSPIK